MNAENGDAIGSPQVPVEKPPEAEKPAPSLLNTPVQVLITRRLPRWLFVHNPFYLISAALVFYGLYVRFNSSSVASNGWWLLALMCGYTAILAVTAVMIVRLGKVWEDARSILILVPLLFLATSVSLDEMGIRYTRQMALPLVLTAFAAAVVISQVLIRSMGIRLRGYIVAFYAILGVFFLYPLGVMLFQEYVAPSNVNRLALAVLGFPLAQAAAFLTLLPAIRRGGEYVRNNGTPWEWPGFPLVLFGLLALAVCARQYFLTLSFIPVEGMASPFGSYALAPFILVVAVLMLEMGCVSGRARIRWAAMALPILAVLLSFSSADRSGVYGDVLEMIRRAAGTPVLWAAGGALLVYVYAAIRRVPGSEAGILIVLAIGSTVGVGTLDLETLVRPSPWALAAIAALEILLCWRRASSWRALAALAALLGALISAGADRMSGEWLSGIAIHLGLFGALAIGAAFRDRVARALHAFCAVIWAPLVFLVPFGATHGYSQYSWLPLIYSGAMTCLAFGYWRLTDGAGFKRAGVASFGLVIFHLFVFAWRAGQHLEQVQGLTAMLVGMAFFVIAVLISLIKGGVFRRGSHIPSESASGKKTGHE